MKRMSSENFTIFLSVLALSISGVTMYFQFFYENYSISTSFIGGGFSNDSTLTVRIIYNNKGTRYATILGTNVIVYSYKETSKSGLKMSTSDSKWIETDEFQPVILNPGQQFYQELKQPADFNKLYSTTLPFSYWDTIGIALNFSFINSDGQYADKQLPIGWLLLSTNENYRPEFWEFNYSVLELKSEKYYVKQSRKPNIAR